jgi:hypothetical protein
MRLTTTLLGTDRGTGQRTGAPRVRPSCRRGGRLYGLKHRRRGRGLGGGIIGPKLEDKIAMYVEGGAIHRVLANTCDGVLVTALEGALEPSDNVVQIDGGRKIGGKELGGVHVHGDLALCVGPLESRLDDVKEGNVEAVPLRGNANGGLPVSRRALAPYLILVFTSDAHSRLAREGDLHAAATESGGDTELVDSTA